VTTTSPNTYCYDQNGNLERRTLSGSAYNLTYDAENHLTEVRKNGNLQATFTYDGDGNRVKAVWEGMPNHPIIAYIGNYYEYQTAGATTTVRQYYYADATRVAMRVDGDLYWLLGDHLGSTSRVANENGTPLANGEQRYKPWGEKRYPTGASGLPTTFRYTGQRQETGLGPSGGEGLYYYGARWYDPALGRFVQADTIVPKPGSAQAWDRYAYVNNSPLRYTDPSGHREDGPCGPGDVCTDTSGGSSGGGSSSGGGNNGNGGGKHSSIVDVMGNPAKGKVVTKFGALNTLQTKYRDDQILTECGSVKKSKGQICLGDFIENIDYGLHAGVDIQFEEKERNLYAVYDGTVVGVIGIYKDNPYENGGNKIIIEHIFNGEKVYSVYFHIGNTLVQKGDLVNNGDLIGYGHEDADHLHFEMRWAAGVNVDEAGNYSSGLSKLNMIVGTDLAS
jgi:RHS repeat-associated protein